MDFITSEKCTLSTAYGTYSIKNANGQRVMISKVLRQRRDEELSRQIGRSFLPSCHKLEYKLSFILCSILPQATIC